MMKRKGQEVEASSRRTAVFRKCGKLLMREQ
jgi:hypothetical protein